MVLSVICYSAYAQQPIITPGGVVSAASYTQPVAPGSVVSIFGANLSDAVYSAAATPLPTRLGGTSVSINGIPAPVFFVSPAQINVEAPSSLAFSAEGYTTANVVVTTSLGASAPAVVSLFYSGPGVFTTQESGCGQAVALNVAPDGSLSPNTPSNSAAPGDLVAVFGTGFGQPFFPPPDGSPAGAAQKFEFAGGFTINGGDILGLQYGGLAPNLVGIDQANIQIPMDTRDGCAVPVAILGLYNISPTVSISVHSTRGQCVDPAAQSYGTIALVKTTSIGTGVNGETDTLRAWFPSGPQLVRPPTESQTTQGGYVANDMRFPVPGRSCPVPGYLQLSAGTINVSGPYGSATATPSSATDAATYSQSLPPGFLGAGTYSISAGGGSTVGPFQGSVTVDPPIQITSVMYNPDSSYPALTVTWTGVAPNSVVKVSLVYQQPPLPDIFAYAYAAVSAGSFTFEPMCSGRPISAGGSGIFCNLPIPGITEVVVEQMPATDQVSTLQASGITSGIQVPWAYRYIIGPASFVVSAPTSSMTLKGGNQGKPDSRFSHL